MMMTAPVEGVVTTVDRDPALRGTDPVTVEGKNAAED